MRHPVAPRYNDKGERWCGHCEMYKPIDQFKPSAANKASTVCRSCDNAAARRRRPKFNAYLRKKKYGIEDKSYQELYIEQGGACAVCGDHAINPRTGNERQLSVDHDHTTGKIRALLCQKCNLTLGHADEDSVRLRKLADYLEYHSQQQSVK